MAQYNGGWLAYGESKGTIMQTLSARLIVLGPRIAREQQTVAAMIALYCRDQHGGEAHHGGLCDQCSILHAYAMHRLERCQFQEGKTVCAKCQVHCYNPIMHEQIREVLRYAGPRLFWSHPILAIRHVLDGRRSEAILPAKPAAIRRPA